MSSGNRGRLVVEVICSPNAVCEDIYMDDIDISSPLGPPVYTCDGVTGGIGVDCVASNSTEAIAALATKLPSTNL